LLATRPRCWRRGSIVLRRGGLDDQITILAGLIAEQRVPWLETERAFRTGYAKRANQLCIAKWLGALVLSRSVGAGQRRHFRNEILEKRSARRHPHLSICLQAEPQIRGKKKKTRWDPVSVTNARLGAATLRNLFHFDDKHSNGPPAKGHRRRQAESSQARRPGKPVERIRRWCNLFPATRPPNLRFEA